MGNVTTVGLNLAKSVFQVHGVDASGAAVLRQRLTRTRLARTIWAMMISGERYREPLAA